MLCPHCHKEIIEEKLKFDFEEIYKLYPRKLGKANGIKKLKSTIRTQSQFEELRRAVRNFITFHQRAGTGPTFIPYFSSFVSVWTDWTLPDTGTVKIGTPQTETTAQYVERIERKRQAEEEVVTTDPARVREILAKALSGRKMPLE